MRAMALLEPCPPPASSTLSPTKARKLGREKFFLDRHFATTLACGYAPMARLPPLVPSALQRFMFCHPKSDPSVRIHVFLQPVPETKTSCFTFRASKVSRHYEFGRCRAIAAPRQLTASRFRSRHLSSVLALFWQQD